MNNEAKFEYVKIKNQKGVFYLSSQTKSDEYNVEFEKTDDEGNKKKYYHKEFDVLSGKLTAIHLKDGNYGKQVVFYLQQPNDVVYMFNVDVFGQNKKIGDWIKAFALYLENLEINNDTEISLNKSKKDKKGYLFRNVFIKQHGEKVNWAFNPSKDVPKWEKVADEITGEESWSSTKQDKFYYDKIKSVVKEAPQQQEQTSAPKEKTAPKKEEVKSGKVAKKAVQVDVPSDDLPF